ncbi:anti-sigma factor RsbA family regulatory protein [Mycobacterium paraterrae]|uniref:Sensor histidine kinase n=1 Tax=Mycobacterium paraterrae TaxID=577492 RepID=A0ABY3VK19_9MYCO|nr:anti-sigma factor RsbA family regulatory protein [Mycobacterium paraterrae]UMB68996.1 sensor histidine kinase [Mycobacterium paraterrae]
MHRRKFDHSALLYYSEREYVDSLVHFINDGLDHQQPVMLAIPGAKLGPVCDALGDAAKDVTTADITDFGRNPGRIIAGQHAFIDAHPDKHVRVIAEPAWTGRTEHEYLACLQHEALSNLAFSGFNVTGLCPYDASGLDDTVLGHVRLTHPQVWQNGSRTHCEEYAVDAALDRCNQPLDTHPAAVTHTVEHALDLAGARRCAERYGRLVGMAAERIADLLLVTTELATNSLDHAGGPCRLAFWYDSGFVVCEARDMGHWADPLAGRRPPTGGRNGPYGLFVVNAIADLLRTHATARGTTIHAYLLRDDPSEQVECV